MNDQELQATLKQCSLHSLLLVTSRAFARAGFGDVQILDRRQSKQKSRFGGHEIMCDLSVGFFPVRIIVKVLQDGVRLRHLDELAGTVRRTTADMGIVVSPHSLTAGAEAHLNGYQPMRIEVVTGSAFARLLSTYHVGVRSRGEVDYAYFSALEDASEKLISFLKTNDL